ncbi:MAG TPA: hypothetical protein PLG47_05415 [Candidatus Dojkabacteria bacterium]|nr:hypothetical protein [Candidatus Dojkabacteria bacterium]
MQKRDYEVVIPLKHHEVPAKINKQTGEITEVRKRRNNLPKDKKLFQQNDFTKVNNKIVGYLSKELSNMELAIVFKMIGMAHFNTNSLKPLSNETSLRDLAETFGISINSVKKSFEKLFDYGVYAQFKIAKNGVKEYWILNPYISFKGRLIDDSIWENFKGTKVEIAYNIV